MGAKTGDEIKTEIQALKDAKPKVRRRNHFGDDLHEAIDAQIEVLRDGLDEGQVYDTFEDPDDPDDRNQLDAALDALAWMEGEEREDAEFESLAAGWVNIGLG